MRTLLQILVGIPLVVVLIPWTLLVGFVWLSYGLWLHVLVWLGWCARGQQVLLVYSDSPVWRDYIEQHFLPRLPTDRVVLNWSQRKTWRWYKLPVMVFHYFGGPREFNPLVVVFRPFRWTRVFRFWKPFQDYKHGQTQALQEKERQMFSFLEENGIGSHTDDAPTKISPR